MSKYIKCSNDTILNGFICWTWLFDSFLWHFWGDRPKVCLIKMVTWTDTTIKNLKKSYHLCILYCSSKLVLFWIFPEVIDMLHIMNLEIIAHDIKIRPKFSINCIILMHVTHVQSVNVTRKEKSLTQWIHALFYDFYVTLNV